MVELYLFLSSVPPLSLCMIQIPKDCLEAHQGVAQLGIVGSGTDFVSTDLIHGGGDCGDFNLCERESAAV